MNRIIIGLMLALCVVVGAGLVGILDSRATDVFLEATRPDFQKIPIGVFGFQNGGGPEWLGGRIEEVLKADLQRSLVFSLVDLPGDRGQGAGSHHHRQGGVQAGGRERGLGLGLGKVWPEEWQQG